MDLSIGSIRLEGFVSPTNLGRAGAPVAVSLTVAAIVAVQFEVEPGMNKLKTNLVPGDTVVLSVGSIGGADLAGPMRTTYGEYLSCVARVLAIGVIETFPMTQIEVGLIPGAGLPSGEKWRLKEGSAVGKPGWLVFAGEATKATP